MKFIIAATDFTPVSLHAVEYAADLAAYMNAELLLLHILGKDCGNDDALTEFEYDDLLDKAEAQLADLKYSLLQQKKNKVKVNILPQPGTMQYMLARAGRVKKPFAVFVGVDDVQHGVSYCSTNHTMLQLRELGCPVLGIPNDAKFIKGQKSWFTIRKKTSLGLIEEVHA